MRPAYPLVLVLFLMTLAGTPLSAQSDERCFPETGFCIAGPIRDYWERNGGLQVFGYPLGAQQAETVEGSWSGPVQWFERDRLEDHSGEGLGVLAGRLGARYLELTGRPWQEFSGQQPSSSLECRYFPQTGFNACGWFLGYWERNGGLERFGYPITPAFEEQIEGRSYTVQYFERRRMELHPEVTGSPYAVQLGLLGREVRALEQRPPSTAVTPDPRITALLALSVDVTSQNLNLVRVGRDGTSAAIVNADPRPGFAPKEPMAWAPDGSSVTFVDANQTRSVFTLSAEGRRLEEQPVPLPPGAVLDAVDVSPADGTLLLGVVDSSRRVPSSLALLAADGRLRELGPGYGARWSPDGSRLVYVAPGTGTLSDIVVASADGSNARVVGHGYGPAWSPNGSQIAYSDEEGFLTTVTADGTNARRLLRGRVPAWSPDGSRLAFDGGDGKLMVVYSDGADPQVVLDQEGPVPPQSGYVLVNWSPDGAQLAYRFVLRNYREAGVVNLDGSVRFLLSGAVLPPTWLIAPPGR